MNKGFIFLVLSFLQLASAQIKIEGKIENMNKIGLSYSSVSVLNSDIVVLTNEKGLFMIEIPESNNSTTITVEMNGYEKKIVSIDELIKNPIVTLNEKPIQLNEIVVKNTQMKEKIIGQKKRPMLTFSKMFDENVHTIEQGSVFEIFPQTTTNSYSFYIIPSSKFEEITLKVNIYSVKNNQPDESLLNENIIYKTTTTAWQKIDLKPYKLRFKNHDKIAITLQLVAHKKLDDNNFVFGISAKKTTSNKMLFRYHNQGNWESSSGVFISNLSVSYVKGAKKIDKEVVEEIDDKTKELIAYYKYKEEARKSNFGKNKKGKYMGIGDAKIYYEEYGEGEPLIFLHGNNGSIEDFYQQIPFFAKQYHVIAIDTRGQGRSTDLTNTPYTYETFANDLYQVIQKLNLKKVNLVGWSDGGNTALIFNYQHPELINKLVVIGAVLNPFGVQDKLIDDFKNQIDNPSQSTNERLIRLMLNHPAINYYNLQKISNPVLIIAGEKDVVKKEHTEEIQKSIPKSDLQIIPNASHYVPFEYPKVLNETILKFLEK